MVAKTTKPKKSTSWINIAKQHCLWTNAATARLFEHAPKKGDYIHTWRHQNKKTRPSVTNILVVGFFHRNFHLMTDTRRKTKTKQRFWTKDHAKCNALEILSMFGSQTREDSGQKFHLPRKPNTWTSLRQELLCVKGVAILSEGSSCGASWIHALKSLKRNIIKDSEAVQKMMGRILPMRIGTFDGNKGAQQLCKIRVVELFGAKLEMVANQDYPYHNQDFCLPIHKANRTNWNRPRWITHREFTLDAPHWGPVSLHHKLREMRLKLHVAREISGRLIVDNQNQWNPE